MRSARLNVFDICVRLRAIYIRHFIFCTSLQKNGAQRKRDEIYFFKGFVTHYRLAFVVTIGMDTIKIKLSKLSNYFLSQLFLPNYS